MKKIAFLLSLLPLLTACFQVEREMEYAKIYFPLATRATNGVFDASFNQAADTVFRIGAYCSGSKMTPVDVDVQVALAQDEFLAEQAVNTKLAAYTLLPEDCYKIEPANGKVTIKADTERADLRVTFHTSAFEYGKRYILPLKIASVSQYVIADQYQILYFGVTAK